MFLDFRSFSQVVEPRFEVQKIWGFLRESCVDFVLPRCFLMRRKERFFFFFFGEREKVQEKEKRRKEKILFFIQLIILIDKKI